MLTLTKPSDELMRRFLVDQSRLPLTYTSVGNSNSALPEGFTVDRTRVLLGEGESVFHAAETALRRWEHLRLGWVEVWPPPPIRAGEVAVVLSRAIGVWWLNACRIVYVWEELGTVTRFGFAHGTLPGHVARGEERFLIEWDQQTGAVSYEILSFSRPNYILTRLAYPLVRQFQSRFRRDSAIALRRAVDRALHPATAAVAT